jgi:hypothetical protein
MTALDAFSSLSVEFDPNANKIMKEFTTDLRKSLDKIHQKVETSVESSRANK